MTHKPKKTKKKTKGAHLARLDRLLAAIQDDLISLANEEGDESRWNRPRKLRISLRLDAEVVDWLKSHGPGYQTRINGVLRQLMLEGKKRKG